MKIYAFDIGGSSIKHGLIYVSDGQIEIKTRNSVKLNNNEFGELKTKVLKIVELVLKEYNDLEYIGISTTGSVDTNNIVVSAGLFTGYKNVNWEEIIKADYSQIKKVITTNDGRASAWAEFISNTPKHRSHIHVVVGTGVGGGIVYNNELLLGDSGQAGYIGHMKISNDETVTCSCGKNGCVETLASTRGMVYDMEKLSNSKEKFDFQTILKLVEEEDVNAVKVLKYGGYWLGIGIGNCMNLLNPTIVTIGGGVAAGATNIKNKKLQNLYLDSIINGIEYASHRRVFASCDIRLAHYGNDAGMIGAAHLCYSKI